MQRHYPFGKSPPKLAYHFIWLKQKPIQFNPDNELTGPYSIPHMFIRYKLNCQVIGGILNTSMRMYNPVMLHLCHAFWQIIIYSFSRYFEGILIESSLHLVMRLGVVDMIRFNRIQRWQLWLNWLCLGSL